MGVELYLSDYYFTANPGMAVQIYIQQNGGSYTGNWGSNIALSDGEDLGNGWYRFERVMEDVPTEPTALRAVMDDIQSMWEPRASQDGVTLLVGYEGDTELAAVIDGMRLKQVFNNLIGNALKFARNGVVEAGLKAWVEGDQVRMAPVAVAAEANRLVPRPFRGQGLRALDAAGGVEADDLGRPG